MAASSCDASAGDAIRCSLIPLILYSWAYRPRAYFLRLCGECISLYHYSLCYATINYTTHNSS